MYDVRRLYMPVDGLFPSRVKEDHVCAYRQIVSARGLDRSREMMIAY